MDRTIATPRLARRRVIAMAGLAALTLLGAGACGGTSSTSQAPSVSSASFYSGATPGGKPVRGGIATVDMSSAPKTFDPFLGPSQGVGPYQVFDQLFELMPGSSESKPVLQPALVSSWTVSKDHLTYTFHIRSGVRFSNGMPLTGEDVLFSMKQDEAPTSGVVVNTEPWKRIALVGPMTVRLELKRPEPALIETLDEFKFSIVPKSVFLREGATKFGLHPVGTGPFMLKSAVPGFSKFELVRNPYYWRAGEPYLDGVDFNIVEEGNARIIAVRSGTATIAQEIPYADVQSLRASSGVRMLVGPEWGASNNLFNRAKAPFNEVSVRKALMYATPREAIIKSVYKGLGTPANSLWGQLKYWDSKVPLFPYDIAKAKELLKQSSVPHGFSMSIQVPSGETQSTNLASILQSSWAQIGVHASVESQQINSLYNNFFSGKFEFAILPPEAGYYGYFEPDGAAEWVLDNPETGGYAPPEEPQIVAKLKKAALSTSETERAKLFGELQYESYWQQAQLMPIMNLVSLNLVSDRLRGFEVLPSTTIRFERAWLQT